MYLIMDYRGKAQASVYYAGQHQGHADNGTPIKTYNTTCRQAWLISFEVDLHQTPAGHGATCPDGKIMSENPAKLLTPERTWWVCPSRCVVIKLRENVEESYTYLLERGSRLTDSSTYWWRIRGM